MKSIFISIVLLIVCIQQVYSQSFDELPLDKQKTFFEGYWKYVSQNRDTVFIIKLKQLDEAIGINSYIGSYLYYDPHINENNLNSISVFLSMSTFEEYFQLWKNLLNQDTNYIGNAMYLTGWSYNAVEGGFYDYTKNHYHGETSLSVVSFQSGSESISWSLEIGEGSYLVPAGEEDMYFTFSVPNRCVLTKVYDLTEFSDKGIILEPFPEDGKMDFGKPAKP